MKTKFQIPLLCLLLMISTSLVAQKVPSDCNTNDLNRGLLKKDIYITTCNSIYQSNSIFKDSAEFPPLLIDSVAKAMIAVFNATPLPEVDTLYKQLHIRNIQKVQLNNLVLILDPTQEWVEKLTIGNLPTGNLLVDSLLSYFGMQLNNHFEISADSVFTEFTLNDYYNVKALGAVFDSIPGVFANGYIGEFGDGGEIVCELNKDYSLLSYTYKWGPCSFRCVFKRTWVFKVYSNCSVEFIGSSGNTLDQYLGVNELNKSELTISPNPFNSSIQIHGLTENTNYIISDLSGRQLISGITHQGTIANLSNLVPGIYFIELHTPQTNKTYKIVKE